MRDDLVDDYDDAPQAPPEKEESPLVTPVCWVTIGIAIGLWLMNFVWFWKVGVKW